MKTITSLLCLYLLAATSALSFPMRDLIGRWSYQNRATQSTGEVLRTTGHIKVTRNASGDFLFKETNASGSTIANYTMFRDGRFRLSQGPAVSATGRWTRTTDLIRVTGNITTPLGTHRFSCAFTKPSLNDLVIVQRVPDFDTVSRWTAVRVSP